MAQIRVNSRLQESLCSPKVRVSESGTSCTKSSTPPTSSSMYWTHEILWAHGVAVLRSTSEKRLRTNICCFCSTSAILCLPASRYVLPIFPLFPFFDILPLCCQCSSQGSILPSSAYLQWKAICYSAGRSMRCSPLILCRLGMIYLE